MTTPTTPPATPETTATPEAKLLAARQAGQKKMVLCEPCAGIQRNWRRAPGHPELVQGTSRKRDRGDGVTVNVTSYRCDHCGTRWEYENDKANPKAGWSVVGN